MSKLVPVILVLFATAAFTAVILSLDAVASSRGSGNVIGAAVAAPASPAADPHAAHRTVSSSPAVTKPAGTGNVKKFNLTAKTTDVMIDDGVVFKAFTFDDTVPGPQMVVEEGDTVEITVTNEDNVTHGLSVHAANAQTSAVVGNLAPGETRTLTFQADYPGVYMYHCAPGGHGIFTHTMGGQHGMIVVEPKNRKYKLEEELGREPDVRMYVIQHEVYKDGQAFLDGTPTYVMFNGKNFRYVEEPVNARPGDYVRFYYLNVGPNLTSTFHAVGGVWDYVYYGGNPDNIMAGTQSVVSGPTDSWVIDWVVPGEGPFTLVTHAFGTQAIKGAVGVLNSEEGIERTAEVRSEGPTTAVDANPKRVVSPFGIGSLDLDKPAFYRPGDTVQVDIAASTFVPKILEIPVGTEVTWVNGDVFDFLEGERTGKHNVVVLNGPETFASPMLEHADKFSHTFTEPGTYEYLCTVHPYQRGIVKVYRP
jgi:nitrite reductase (NO-forming)